MVYGIQLALEEISLVLFTTLAPSGVVALMLMGVPMLFNLAPERIIRRINRFMCIPLVVSMVGLVMSATHLGNPENVLYVFARIGSSPLSNEVAGAASFLLLAGVYWLYSFAQRPRIALQKAWFCLVCAAGAVFVVLIAYAYAADTIISWNTLFVPLNLVLNSLVGGPLLAFAGLHFARADVPSLFVRSLSPLSFLAAAVNVVCMALQNASLGEIGNELATVAQLVPLYGVAIAAFAVLCAVGAWLCARPLRKRGRGEHAAVIAGCACALAGIFVTRLSFYAMHLTVGLGM